MRLRVKRSRRTSPDPAQPRPQRPPGWGRQRELYEEFSSAVFYVAVTKPDGSVGIGTATHVGAGAFVTAGHVVEGNTIDEIGCSEHKYVRLPST